MFCQTVKPPTKKGQPNEQRCEFCKEPPRIAIITCVHPDVPDDKYKVEFKGICMGDYLFIDNIPAPDWCPLRKNGDTNE